MLSSFSFVEAQWWCFYTFCYFLQFVYVLQLFFFVQFDNVLHYFFIAQLIYILRTFEILKFDFYPLSLEEKRWSFQNSQLRWCPLGMVTQEDGGDISVK